MREIYHYLDYREFLKDFQQDAQERNPAFSARAFLKKAGIGSPSFFRQVVNGERNLTEKTTEAFLLAMRLPEPEALFFRTLVAFGQARTAPDKQLYFEKLRELGVQAKVHIVGSQDYSFYEFWYIPVVREILCQGSWTGDYQALAKRLRPAIGAAEARHAVKVLRQHGFVIENPEGSWSQAHPLLHTGFSVQSLAIRHFNRQMVQLAADSLDTVPVAERNVTGVTLSISPQTYALLTEEIRAFQDRILRMAESGNEADRVYQMNVVLFPVSQPASGRQP